MRTRHILTAVFLTWALGAVEARAHFLFIRIGPMAEGGRAAEVYFSEQAEAGDPRFVAKFAHTELWVQEKPGEFRSLTVSQAADRLRAHLPGSGTAVVVGRCEYGVRESGKQPPFLLRYYPKAIAGSPGELNAMRPRPENALEIAVKIEADGVQLALLRNGQPVPNVVFHTVDSDLQNQEVKAGAQVQARWTPPAPGRYSVYAQQNTKARGTLGGKAYEEIREFATLAFSWPLEQSEADPEAVALFEQALAARAQWKAFPGFSADLEGEVDGRHFSGLVKVDREGGVSLSVDDEPCRPWVKSQLESITMHRRAEAHSTDDHPVLWFADDRDDHPLGRLLVFEGGQFASTYRVKDRQITVVNRHMARSNMTITTLDNERTPEGTYLPRSYVVQTWDDSTGELRRTETVQDRWTRVGSLDLPAAHTVTMATSGGLSVRSITLSGHKLISPP